MIMAIHQQIIVLTRIYPAIVFRHGCCSFQHCHVTLTLRANPCCQIIICVAGNKIFPLHCLKSRSTHHISEMPNSHVNLVDHPLVKFFGADKANKAEQEAQQAEVGARRQHDSYQGYNWEGSGWALYFVLISLAYGLGCLNRPIIDSSVWWPTSMTYPAEGIHHWESWLWLYFLVFKIVLKMRNVWILFHVETIILFYRVLMKYH